MTVLRSVANFVHTSTEIPVFAGSIASAIRRHSRPVAVVGVNQLYKKISVSTITGCAGFCAPCWGYRRGKPLEIDEPGARRLLVQAWVEQAWILT